MMPDPIDGNRDAAPCAQLVLELLRRVLELSMLEFVGYASQARVAVMTNDDLVSTSPRRRGSPETGNPL